MKNRNFTLIELIVVIGVLGILAAIVVPNISNVTEKAKEVQIAMDADAIQTATDMFRLDSADGVSEPFFAADGSQTNVATDAAVLSESAVGADDFLAIDVAALAPDHLREVPGYYVDLAGLSLESDATIAGIVTGAELQTATSAAISQANGDVFFGMVPKYNDAGDAIVGSTSVVKALTLASDVITVIE